MTYGERVLALTPVFAKLSISPESSDGFASVGTILPKEEAALLPGGLFAFSDEFFRGWGAGYQSGIEGSREDSGRCHAWVAGADRGVQGEVRCSLKEGTLWLRGCIPCWSVYCRWRY